MTTAHRLAMTAFGFALAVAGCASGTRTVRMSTSLDIPAAQGEVKASPAANGNTSLEVEVHHLATPDRVALGATTYVVWARALDQDAPQNLGALRVDRDLNGTLKTVTPLRSFDVFITAEPSPMTMAPTNSQLFTASIPRGSE